MSASSVKVMQDLESILDLLEAWILNLCKQDSDLLCIIEHFFLFGESCEHSLHASKEFFKQHGSFACAVEHSPKSNPFLDTDSLAAFASVMSLESLNIQPTALLLFLGFDPGFGGFILHKPMD
jgi:hypothetical protein